MIINDEQASVNHLLQSQQFYVYSFLERETFEWRKVGAN